MKDRSMASDELGSFLQRYITKGTILYLTTPILQEKHNRPHDQVMAIGILHKTVHGFSLLQQLWKITKKRLIITYLEDIHTGMSTTLSNERLYIYTYEYIGHMIKSHLGTEKYLTMHMTKTRHGYTEAVVFIDRDEIHGK